MALKIKVSNQASGEGFDVPPAGSHPAVLVAVVDLGTHTEDYKGKEKQTPKILLAWELTAERKPGSTRNFVVGRDYTANLGEKSNLRALLKNWRGKDLVEGEEFDFGAPAAQHGCLGRKCLVNLVHKVATGSGRTYARVENISALPKGMTVPSGQYDPFSWDMDSDNLADLETRDWLPFLYGRPVVDVIRESREYQSRDKPEAQDDSSEDEPSTAATNGESSDGDIPW
jgi:hypothetical protein